MLATLLDLALEPVAVHVVFYWQWLVQGSMDYYGVLLMNFVVWFVVAFVFVAVADVVLQKGRNAQRLFSPHEQVVWVHVQKMGKVERLAMLVPLILFLCSLFMFGLVDLTHGYYWGAVSALCAGLIVAFLWRSHNFTLASPTYELSCS